jgi:hypothetical protein
MESKSLVVCLNSNLLGFISIDDSPSLVQTIMSVPNKNFLSFTILSLIDIKCLLVLDVNEVLTSVLEDLEPSRVGAPDLHFVSSSSTLNVP